ncbi:hypothetical protein GGE09_004363 [Roseobacter sp. N2S]|jgi:hypothetical protein|nr:hypothetical protein [Roseobacter sp. N2S]
MSASLTLCQNSKECSLAVTKTWALAAEGSTAAKQTRHQERKQKQIYNDRSRSQLPTIEFKSMVNDLVAKFFRDFLL